MRSAPLLTILGPTACGKTSLAVRLAAVLKGEVISADSRQVYRGMNVGTGKDLAEYQFQGETVPYHLIDIRDAGEEYDVFQFQDDFFKLYEKLSIKGVWPILCGGSGLYLQAALAEEQMVMVPENKRLRERLRKFSQEELVRELAEIRMDLHNKTDLEERDRTIRAIEIASFERQNPERTASPVQEKLTFGLRTERGNLRERIKVRLEKRLEQEGMIEEVQGLLESGIPAKKIDYYGLEYRFINAYLQKDLTYQEMYEGLLQAIRRFAKKQETWFRRMEKNGHQIHWMEVESPMEEKLSFIKSQLPENVT
ncbi:MAG: tRNA (adenosine(37)-N6)-dimethylallyltransferase MiaA [Vicingaceae bacterium]